VFGLVDSLGLGKGDKLGWFWRLIVLFKPGYSGHFECASRTKYNHAKIHDTKYGVLSISRYKLSLGKNNQEPK
jgi:hypothetical protein